MHKTVCNIAIVSMNGEQGLDQIYSHTDTVRIGHDFHSEELFSYLVMDTDELTKENRAALISPA